MRFRILFVLGFLFIACSNKSTTLAHPLATQEPIENVPISTDGQVVNQCPSNMIFIEGDYCPVLEEICLKWIDDLRCAEFKKPTRCLVATRHMAFCIDKYEYPNQLNVKPKLQVNWNEAKELCHQQNKRLCVDTEWTQACRGQENLPYPYGYIRDASACRIDLKWADPQTTPFNQLDKTVPSGSMPRCVSPYGVYDMTGNADEFCQTSGGTPYQSVLKGGHPHGVRNRCTPETVGHDETFKYYITGFRCCSDTISLN